MNTGQWIAPKPAKPRRSWLVTVVSTVAGLASLLAMIAACSSFAQGVKDGYQSSTTGYTAKPTPPPLTTTPPPTSAAVTVAAGARDGGTLGLGGSATRPPSTTAKPPATTDPPVLVPEDEPLSAPDPEAEVNAPSVPTHFSSCKAAKAAGAAPLHRGEPGYSSRLDRDGDGTACET